jgi:hypothetical protein
MKPEDIGRRFGIGVRVAGRIAKQRAESRSAETSSAGATAAPRNNAQPAAWPRPTREQVREHGKTARRAARAAGRGVGGFLRPFRRVGGILWLEVTGFFFGLFAAGFAFHLWQVRSSYASGPQHAQFLIAAGLTVVFGYLSISAFWRAGRK